MDIEEKTYGEVSHSELEKFRYKFGKLKTETSELKKDFAKIRDADKWNRIFTPSSDWTSFYLLSYPEQVASMKCNGIEGCRSAETLYSASCIEATI